MDEGTRIWLSPDEQIAEVEVRLAEIRSLPPTASRDQLLRDGEAYLEQIQALHLQGELAPLRDHASLPL